MSTVMQKDGSGNYTLITTEDSNRLVDITVSVYKDKGGSYPFDESDKLASVDAVSYTHLNRSSTNIFIRRPLSISVK